MARADSLLEPRSVTVHFEDLDINSTRGAAVLYNRISSLPKRSAATSRPSRSLALSARYASCVRRLSARRS